MRKILVCIILAFLMVSLASPILKLFPLPVKADETTSTFYSEASDGQTWETGAVYATVWNTVTSHADHVDIMAVVGQWGSVGAGYNIYRAYVAFNTSSISESMTITSATLGLWGYADYTIDPADEYNVTIQNGQPTYPHDPIVAGDYAKGNYSGNGGQYDTTDGWSLTAYNNITLNADGLDWINKTDITKLCLRSDKDIDGVAPDSTAGHGPVDFDTNESAHPPLLTVTYATIPVRVQDSFENYITTGGIMNVTLTSTPTQGNLIVAACGGQGVESIVQDGVSWTSVVEDAGGYGFHSEIWAGLVCSTDANKTIQITCSWDFELVDICEYSGINDIDQTAHNAGTDWAVYIYETATTTDNIEVWVGAAWMAYKNQGGLWAAESSPGFAQFGNFYVSPGSLSYLENIVTSTGEAYATTYSGDYPLTHPYSGCMATFYYNSENTTVTSQIVDSTTSNAISGASAQLTSGTGTLYNSTSNSTGYVTFEVIPIDMPTVFWKVNITGYQTQYDDSTIPETVYLDPIYVPSMPSPISPVTPQLASTVTWYFEGSATTVNYETGYGLNSTVPSGSTVTVSDSWPLEDSINVGLRLWHMNPYNLTTELTSGIWDFITVNSTASTDSIGYYQPPMTSLLYGKSSLKLVVYFSGSSSTAEATFVTDKLNYGILDAQPWTITMTLSSVVNATGIFLNWTFGDGVSGIDNIVFESSVFDLAFSNKSFFEIAFGPYTTPLGVMANMAYGLIVLAIFVSLYSRTSGLAVPAIAVLCLGGTGGVLGVLIPPVGIALLGFILLCAGAVMLYGAWR